MDAERPVAVEARALAKAYGEGEARVEALRGVDLAVRAGEFVAVMGPSGSGKSTLLHLLGALDRPSSGDVILEGRPLAGLDDDALAALRRRRIGFVFQAFNLVEILTAAENVALPIVLDGTPEREAEPRALAALESVGLADRATHRPAALSGGERQRVAIARALVTEPALVLADEPTGNLDTDAGGRVLEILRRLVDERGRAVLAVTHDPVGATRADRIVELRDGRIVGERRP
jgi:putative ABC transport system ATP-binding protein